MTTKNTNFDNPAKVTLLSPTQGERLNIIGGGVRILIDGQSSGGRCSIFECPIPVGDGPPLHRHENEDEMFYVLEGRFKISVDGKEVIVEAGAFASLPRGSVHAFKNIGSMPGRLLVTCTPSGLEVPFRAVCEPGATENRKPLSQEEIIQAFEKHGVTFVGPPLE